MNDPSHDRGMNDSDAALSHHFAHVTVAKFVGDVPTDSLDDQKAIKVAPCEEGWCIRGKLGHATDYRHTLRFAPEPTPEQQQRFDARIAERDARRSQDDKDDR